MGSLTPGASYSYKRENGIVYATETGSTTAKAVGYDYSQNYASNFNSMQDAKFWGELRREARTNVALQKALDRAIIIYRLSKDNPK